MLFIYKYMQYSVHTYVHKHTYMYMQYVYTIQTYLPTYVYHMYSTHYSIA